MIRYAKFKLIKKMYGFFPSIFFSEHIFTSHRTAVLRSAQYGKCCTRVYSVMSATTSVIHFSSSYFHLSTKYHFINSSVEKVSLNQEPESQFSLTVRAKFNTRVKWQVNYNSIGFWTGCQETEDSELKKEIFPIFLKWILFHCNYYFNLLFLPTHEFLLTKCLATHVWFCFLFLWQEYTL